MLLLLAACAKDDAPIRVPMASLEGTVAWELVYDEAAEDAGFVDCTYTRVYDALEDRSAPWLCPRCDELLRAAVTMPAAEIDCWQQLGGDVPSDLEWIGWKGDSWRRSSVPYLELSDQGALAFDDEGQGTIAYTSEPLALDAGTVTLQVTGEVAVGETKGDPWHGFTPPDAYACDWPKHDPPPFDGPWRVAEGAPLPDGWFLDTCAEPVRLYDLLGRWLVVDISAMDCGPCQAMAEEEQPWVDDMRSRGFEVEVVTLLAPSLGDILGETTLGDLESWSSTFDLEGPVLADRGWGFSMMQSVLGEGVASYPTTFVVAPDGTVASVQQGYGGWALVEAVIVGGG